MEEEVYRTTWRNKWITSHATSIDDFIETFESLAKMFRKWKEMGIELSDDGGVGDDYATFCTNNMDIAIKANFVFQFSENKENYYLDTLSGKEIKVPEEKLKLMNKPS